MLHTSKPQHAESNALFARYQTGDTNALGELYNRWNAFVCKKISNVFKTPEDIEDVASDVWVRVQREAHKWDLQKKNFYNFLYLHIRYCIAESLRVRNTVKGGRNYTDIRYSLTAETDSQKFLETHIACSEYSPLDRLIYQEQIDILERAIAVCEFPKETQQILRLYMQGWTHKEIQQRVPTFNCVGAVSARLSSAIAEIKQAIDPITFQVSTLSPRERRERQKKHLAKQSGANLAKLCKSKKWGARELARTLNLRVDTLLEYLKGDRTPDAPLLKNLAGILGEKVYAIYAPPITDFSYCREGRRLWYQRVRRGLSFARAEELTGVKASQIFNYEKGGIRPKSKTLAKLAKAYCVSTKIFFQSSF